MSTNEDAKVKLNLRLGKTLHERLRAKAEPVVDDEWLVESFRQPLSYQARRDVGGATGCKSYNDAHRPRWIGLRLRDPRHSRERANARGQM
jgi:hypothetical protein